MTSQGEEVVVRAIDGCPHTFEELASRVLPDLMEDMSEAIRKPQNMSLFSEKGQGVQSLAKQFDKGADFSGCYVLIGQLGPFYVGISRKVLSRLRQHVNDKTHYGASLAYRMAVNDFLQSEKGKELERSGGIKSVTRSMFMQIHEFREAFERAQSELKKMRVAFIEIPNPLVLYLFEAYCAMRLGTAEWNTFRTH